MRDRYEIKLPKDFEPRWPARLACPAAPTTTVRIARDSDGGFHLASLSSVYSSMTGRSVEMPACAACADSVDRQRRYRQRLELVMVAIAVGIAVYFVRGLGWRAAATAFGIAMLALVPYIFWTAFFPPIVDITVTDAWITYEFTDPEFAQAFLDLNGTANR